MRTDRVKHFVDRVEKLDEEQRAIGMDKKEVFDEAKKDGVNTKALRRLIAERKRKDADAEIADTLDAYRAAMEEPGATYRSVSKKMGVPRSTLHRLVPREKNGTAISTAGDENGNGNEQRVRERDREQQAERAGIGDDAAIGPAGREPPPAAGPALVGGGEVVGLRAAADADADRDREPGDAARADAGDAGVSARDGGDDQRGDFAPGRDLLAAAGTAVTAVLTVPLGAGEDGLEIPAFLRRAAE